MNKEELFQEYGVTEMDDGRFVMRRERFYDDEEEPVYAYSKVLELETVEEDMLEEYLTHCEQLLEIALDDRESRLGIDEIQ